MSDSSNLLPRQGSFISFENLSDAEESLNFKYNGLRVYINSEDKFYYYKDSVFILEPQSSNSSGPGTQNLYIQQLQPVSTGNYVWFELNPDNSIKTIWLNS